MATELKLRRGTTSQHSSFTGAEAEVTVDTDKETVVVHDGSTVGGYALAREDMSNVPNDSISGDQIISLDKISEGNSSVEVVDTGAGSVAVTVDGSEIARFDADGRLTIGDRTGYTINSNGKDLVIGKTSDNAGITLVSSNTDTGGGIYFADTDSSNVGRIIYNHDQDEMRFRANGNDAVKIDSSANLQFNSGYGSVATAYGCRAWVNFDGTGTVSIRDSGNVSSITDNGTGNYTVNFTTAMPDSNYASVGDAAAARIVNTEALQETSFDVRVFLPDGSSSDRTAIQAMVVR